MSNPLFANSKSALVFAGITIFGTLMMVGPGGGILGQAKDRFGRTSEPAAEEPAPVLERERPKPVAEPLDPAAGWGGTGGDAVFGDYASAEVPESEVSESEVLPEEDNAEPASSASPAFVQPQVRRISALPQATGGPVKADSLGELVPRDDSGEAPRAEAVVTSRAISIEPQ